MIYRGAVETTTRARALRLGIVATVAVASWLGPAAGHAAELGGTVWVPMVDPEKGAEETFELNTLGVIREGESANADWRICRGKYRESVSRHDFFITVGRPDLARRESSRQAKHTGLVVGGVAATIAGVWVLGATFTEGGWDPPAWLGGGLMAGGLIAFFLVSDLFEGPDLKVDEAEGLVRRYNEHLQEHLKPPADRDNRIQAMHLFQSLHLTPWLAPGTGGLAVAARF
jgi:hypothetical protein